MVQKGVRNASLEIACILQLILEVFPTSHCKSCFNFHGGVVILKEDWNLEFGVEEQRIGKWEYNFFIDSEA